MHLQYKLHIDSGCPRKIYLDSHGTRRRVAHVLVYVLYTLYFFSKFRFTTYRQCKQGVKDGERPKAPQPSATFERQLTAGQPAGRLPSALAGSRRPCQPPLLSRPEPADCADLPVRPAATGQPAATADSSTTTAGSTFEELQTGGDPGANRRDYQATVDDSYVEDDDADAKTRASGVEASPPVAEQDAAGAAFHLASPPRYFGELPDAPTYEEATERVASHDGGGSKQLGKRVIQLKSTSVDAAGRDDVLPSRPKSLSNSPHRSNSTVESNSSKVAASAAADRTSMPSHRRLPSTGSIGRQPKLASQDSQCSIDVTSGSERTIQIETTL